MRHALQTCHPGRYPVCVSKPCLDEMSIFQGFFFFLFPSLRPDLFQIKKLTSFFPSLPFLFVCTCHGTCEVRGQPAGVILNHVGSEDWTQVAMFGSNYLYWLNHLASYKTGSYYIAQVDLKYAILLFQLTECWDYKHAPPHPEIFYSLFGEEN